MVIRERIKNDNPCGLVSRGVEETSDLAESRAIAGFRLPHDFHQPETLTFPRGTLSVATRAAWPGSLLCCWYSTLQKLSGSQSNRHFRTIKRSVGIPSSKTKLLKQSAGECSPENSASRANVSPYSPYQPIYGQHPPAATTDRYQRFLSSYQIPTMPRLPQNRLVRLLQRPANLHLHASKQWRQRYFAKWG